MSSSEEQTELKGGHPPAVKAGGMRVARHRKFSGSEEKPVTATEEKPGAEGDKEELSTSPTKSDKHSIQMVVSGAVTKGDKDFPAEAVKHYHEKQHSQPTKEKHPVSKPHVIQQPR